MSELLQGMTYAPKGKPKPVCGSGDFVFAVAALDHGHIYGQCNGLIEAGGEVAFVYDPDPAKVTHFCKAFPQAKPVDSLERILEDKRVALVAAAAIPCDRGPLGIRVMGAGKDYFTDKTPFTSLEQLAAARKKTKESGRKYMVYYSERLHSECGIFAGELIAQGHIGRVVSVIGLGPHRLSASSRPAWFFEKAKYGGILTDIGSHQAEQFLFYSGASDARVVHSAVANYANPAHSELEDFGEANLVGNNGVTNYFRVDWLTPDGLGTWGDGRTLIQGTKGYIELRKYIDVGRDPAGDQLYLVTQTEEKHLSLKGKVGFPFFGELILDCLNRTEKAMTQEHAFKAAELCLQAQAQAMTLA